MIERLVENWLANSTERAFQVPFCHILTSKGFTVLHLTRHCGMELGKDVLATDPSGHPCAFQLKTADGARISLREWRKEINSQVFDLVTTKLVHPSLPDAKHHRSFLVTNSGIDEEVMRAIDDMNRKWSDAGQHHLKLETIVGGEICRDSLDLGTNLWPTELGDVKTLLELFLLDGKGRLEAAKLCQLFEATLPLGMEKKVSNAKNKRAMSSAGVLCAIAMANFTNEDNYVAEIEAWIIYLAHVMAVAERWKLPASLWKTEFLIAYTTIRNLLENLIEELKERDHLIEGDPANDVPFRRVRITRLVALVSIFALWKMQEDGSAEVDEFARSFCDKYRQQMWMWGEGAIPLLLAFYWFWRKVDSTPSITFMLSSLIDGICQSNSPMSDPASALPNPYYSESDVLAERLGIDEDPWEEDFRKNSYYLESLVHLFARQNWKERMRSHWPDVTRVWFNRFDPRGKWRFFLWRTDKGTHWSVAPKYPQEWGDLREQASEHKGGCIPASIKKHPILLALFLCVYPHRQNAEIVRWLDTQLGKRE